MGEINLQIEVVMDYLYPLQKKNKNFEFFASLNEAALKGSSGRSKNTRMALISTLKKMGLKNGIPDLVFLVKGGKVFFIELKTESGVLSENQKFRIPILEDLGFSVYVCRSLDDVRGVFKSEGLDDLD